MATESGDRAGARRGGRHRRGAAGAGAATTASTGGGVQAALADPVPGMWGGAQDGTHLRPFTQTAQVPVVGAGAVTGMTIDPRFDPRFAPTGIYQVFVPLRRRRPPLGLRIALWLTTLLLAAGVAGLVIHHVRPQWLRSLEVRPAGPATATETTVAARSPATTTPHRAPTGPVSQTSTALDSANIAVRAASYDVVVTPQAPCWVQVTSPASFAPSFSGVLPAGAAKTFPSAGGLLTVQLGASHVVVTVQIAGKTVPGWQFAPSATPFTVNFASTSG